MLAVLLLAQTPLLHETWENLKDWTVIEGARTADGPMSRVSVDDGALKLEGDRETRRWSAVTRTVPLAKAKWVRLSGRMRTQEVDVTAGRFANCNVYLRFGRGPVQALRLLTGSNNWTQVARRIQVPEGETEITIGCFLSLPGRAWFDDVRVEEAQAPLWKELKDDIYLYRWLGESGVPDASRTYNRESLKVVMEFLGVEPPAQVVYVRYPDLDAIEELTGRRGNAFASGNEIHTIWPTDRHEIVHVLARPWGETSALLGEGLAVYLSGAWQGRPVADYAATLAKEGKWVSIAKLRDTRTFRSFDDLVTYPIAGAFVKWVIDKHGKAKLKQLYARPDNFREILGATPEEVDKELRR